MSNESKLIAAFNREGCNACGHHCGELSALIAKGEAKPEDCVLFSQDFELFADGEYVPLAPFIRNMMSKAILGMASELKGVDIGQEIKIILKPSSGKAEE